MDLANVYIQGFKRFRARSNFKTNGKVVAIVGANEAGKSSLLQALAHLGNDDAPVPGEISRGSRREEFLIEGRFFLSQEELELAGLQAASWLVVRKVVSGSRSYDVAPAPPKRDLTHRGRLWQLLNFAITNKRFRARIDDDADEDLDDRWDEVSPILQSDEEDLSDDDQNTVSELVQLVERLTIDKDAATIKKIPGSLADFISGEAQPNPRKYALEALTSRIPEFIVFEDEDRDLQSEYSIPALGEAVPSALDSLCVLAELDVPELVQAQERGDTAYLTTLEHSANDNLRLHFGENWQQSGVRVTLRIQGEVLAVQVVNEQAEFTSFAERSDGLRQFVALQAFSTCNWSGLPILLIDEAEQKLHYDAQADLVQMLARQRVASKVIFTTHSAGCLPEDLGNGVRLTRPSVEFRTQSEIVNKFWADNEPGFAPLLFGMGASTLAFFPTRNAVMVEGPSDMLLLPTMFREALSTDVLGFQFVPGLSFSDDVFHAPVLGKKSGVLFLTDGDSGGESIRTRLLSMRVERKNVFSLRSRDGNAVDVEDFVDCDLIVAGVNALLRKFHGAVTPLAKRELVAKHRMAAVETWFKRSTNTELPKVELAYEILEMLSDEPTRVILDAKRKASFKAVAEAVLERFRMIKQ
jgi:energy-coupling factor transporter ATP-binding protein EcfA2